jgi:hypothetical protein
MDSYGEDPSLKPLLDAWASYKAAGSSLRTAAGFGGNTAFDPDRAFALAITAAAVGGTPDPTSRGLFDCDVIGQQGERIHVCTLDATRGWYRGLVITFDELKWDRLAMVALSDTGALAVHVLDAAAFHRVARHFATDNGRGAPVLTSDVLCMCFWLHMNISMDPVVAEVLGVQSHWFCEEPNAAPVE